ncbi:MOSC domain-containing protein YiiM [Microbacterium resistens]|uniref:MOSC domain-containing protein YiiM n=1 Tax=Microbacterium resistens TaxID=156977 RepID=A0ABU1S7J8_9MICO|nr:MOSC domain-containing protein [Microbacterium resistens]MDR6865601.1 MOSC domain-containing protein YiiM [Microbacterium resistens]
MPRLLAVCVVHQLLPDAGTVGTTAIDKRPVDGPVKVGRYGAYADVQADRKHHGGLEKALYAYAQEDADWWGAELGHEIAPGVFGENLRTEGIDVNAARIGEVWRIGEGPRAVEVEVTMPRTPCQTFARRMGEHVAEEAADGWVRRFSDARRLGPYLRVLRTGRVSAGDPIEVLLRPEGPTILDIYRGA